MAIADHSERLESLAGVLTGGRQTLAGYLDELEERFTRIEPEIQAFVEEPARFARLRVEAAQLLEAYPHPQDRPALFGVPVGVKDIFHVEGLVTRAGTVPPPERLQGPEAEAIHRLKQAGALILGKTVTTEFGYFAPGPTRNPHNPDHTPGGSSSGSAAAVGAGLCPLAVGSQTIGSIIRPAAYCGVVGYKPSYGRISRVGMIPLAPSVDHTGFLTTDAVSARLAASQLCYDWSTRQGRPRPVLGVPEGPYLEYADQVAVEHLRHIIGVLEQAGFVTRPVPALADFDQVQRAHHRLVAGEAARVHQRWYADYVETYHPTTLALVRDGQAVSDDELTAARESCLRLRHQLTQTMDAYGIDLWITPSATGPAPAGLANTGDPVMNLPWSHAGLPALGLPAGLAANGLPLGVQLVGRWFADEELMSQATVLEQALAPLQGRPFTMIAGDDVARPE
jgi:Asp-tRNA(Asn)/Glu-tRNA(Gln) amidotransferase A subunit family amidase